MLPDNDESIDDQLNFDSSLLSDDDCFEELELPSKNDDVAELRALKQIGKEYDR